jgi:ABC-type amino acid transport substrate-binding protein
MLLDARQRLAALTLLLLLAAWPCSGQPRVIQAGTPEGLPGFTLGGDGRLTVDDPARQQVFACVERQLNAVFTWHPLPTKRLVHMVTYGQLDIAFPMGFTTERAAAMRQSAPMWDNPDVWLSLRPVSTQDKTLRIAARLGSPQHLDHARDGYTRVMGTTTYSELGRTLAMDMADVVIVPRSIFEEQRAQWPRNTIVTAGRPRSSGFYVQPADSKALLAPLNRAIEGCRAAHQR